MFEDKKKSKDSSELFQPKSRKFFRRLKKFKTLIKIDKRTNCLGSLDTDYQSLHEPHTNPCTHCRPLTTQEKISSELTPIGSVDSVLEETMRIKRSFLRARILSCLALWLCWFLFGFLAYRSIMSGRRAKQHGDDKLWTYRLRLSYFLSFVGFLTGIGLYLFVIFLLVPFVRARAHRVVHLKNDYDYRL